MADALITGLESCLTNLEESISETDRLITSKKNEAVRRRSEIKLDLSWRLFKQAFPRDPTRAELSKLSGLSEKTVDSILNSERFNLYMRSVEKSSRSENYKRVETVNGVPVLLKKRRGRSKFCKKEGRPHITYVEKHNGMPRAIAFWNEIFPRLAGLVGNNPDIKQELEQVIQKLDAENKHELGRVNRDAVNETYLPEVTGAIAHRLFQIYALPSCGRVYSYTHNMFNGVIDKLADIIEKYLKKLNDSKGSEYLQEARCEAKKNSAHLKKIAEFSRLATKKENVVATAFQKWINRYGGKSEMKNIKQMLLEAHKDKETAADWVQPVFNLIKKQTQDIISFYSDSIRN